MSAEANLIKTPYYIVHGFRPETENFEFSKKKGYHQKEHLERNRMAQISTS